MRVSEDRVLRKICGSKREEVAGTWRKLHYEELHNKYTPPRVIRVVKARWMSCVGYVGQNYKWERHTKLWTENLKGSPRLGWQNIRMALNKMVRKI
jgi:hypothetical protein